MGRIAGRIAVVCAVLLLAGGVAFAALAWHPAIEAVTPPRPDPALVARGAELAALGDCAGCHTAPGGRAYAGSYRLQTPFGAIYSSNLTPDPDTGIGRWSLPAFVRAMREGVSREGSNLYPALPYDHFTRVSDEDLGALYAFLEAGEPVRADRPANELPFPLSWRPLLTGWKLLFLRDRRFRPDPGRDAQWNRGAYLVEGLGHCGACHTPRNSLGAEETDRALQGGVAEGWSSWPLSGDGWSEDSFYWYLRVGVDRFHGAAAGPMAPVSWNLGRVADADVRAMAHYLASAAGPVRGSPRDDPAVEESGMPGAAIFAGACNACHGQASPMHAAGYPYLNTSTAVQADDPGNVLRVILGGIRPNPARPGPQMPSYATMLSDEQVAAVAAYVRARYAPERPAWTGPSGQGLAEAVRHVRGGGGS